MTKLAAYGITGSVHAWIRNFLSNEMLSVRVGHTHSSKERVLSGIPQGSILGPILFTVFLNDPPDAVKSTCKIFADDKKIYNCPENKDITQSDINKLQDWSLKWNLYFNVQKCKVLHVGKRNPKCEYVMENNGVLSNIPVCTEEKDLGVVFDEFISFDSHIQKAVNKANQMVGLIKRAFTYLDKETLLLLYKSLVRPHLEYGNIIWSPYLKRQSIAIEKVQRRVTKLLHECEQLTYSERLDYLDLPSLKGRRYRGDLIEMFKIFHNLEDVNFDNHFSLSKLDITRNSEGKLFIKHSNTNKRKFSFTNRIIQPWNALPTTYKFAKDTNTFKNLLDNDKTLQSQFLQF